MLVHDWEGRTSVGVTEGEKVEDGGDVAEGVDDAEVGAGVALGSEVIA